MAGFQMLLALGLPLGHAAFGGADAVLPSGLRRASGVSVAVFLVATFVVLVRAGIIRPWSNYTVVRIGIWVFAVVFGLSTLANIASSSPWERYLLAPIALVLAVCCVIVGRSKPLGSIRPVGASQRMDRRIRRLTSSDAGNLSNETFAAPMHIGAVATLEGAPLMDSTGALRLSVIKNRLERRLGLLPQLRRRLHRAGLLRGRPLWVDDANFSIHHHVFEAAVVAPGGEIEVLAAAERILRPVLDRSFPLWELWFLSGVAGGRVGLVLKLHHAVTDGLGAVALMGTLMDLEPDVPDPEAAPWSPIPGPGGWELFGDNLSGRIHGLGRAGRGLAHPLRLHRALRDLASQTAHALWDSAPAPRTSINGEIRPARELRTIRFSLAEAKEVAHAHGAKVNDVFLDIVAGGLRALFAARDEIIDGGQVIVSIPVSLRGGESGDLGNQIGAITIPLPIEHAARRRLQLIAAATRRAKAEQRPEIVQGMMAWVASIPIAHTFITHQRMINTFATNVMGPPVPVFLLGARVLDILPFVPLGGNVLISFAAISYVETLNLLVVGDASISRDIDAVAAGMRATWLELRAPAVLAPLANALSPAAIAGTSGQDMTVKSASKTVMRHRPIEA